MQIGYLGPNRFEEERARKLVKVEAYYCPTSGASTPIGGNVECRVTAIGGKHLVGSNSQTRTSLSIPHTPSITVHTTVLIAGPETMYGS